MCVLCSVLINRHAAQVESFWILLSVGFSLQRKLQSSTCSRNTHAWIFGWCGYPWEWFRQAWTKKDANALYLCSSHYSGFYDDLQLIYSVCLIKVSESLRRVMLSLFWKRYFKMVVNIIRKRQPNLTQIKFYNINKCMYFVDHYNSPYILWWHVICESLFVELSCFFVNVIAI